MQSEPIADGSGRTIVPGGAWRPGSESSYKTMRREPSRVRSRADSHGQGLEPMIRCVVLEFVRSSYEGEKHVFTTASRSGRRAALRHGRRLRHARSAAH